MLRPAFSSCGEEASLITGAAFSWWRPLLLWSTGARAHRLPQSRLTGSAAWRHVDPMGQGLNQRPLHRQATS